MDLWGQGRFEDLWEKGSNASKMTLSEEDFIGLMKRSPRTPDVGWMREKYVTSIAKDGSHILIQARIGFLINGNDKTETRVFRMVKEDGEWRIMLGEIINLAKPLEYGY